MLLCSVSRSRCNCLCRANWSRSSGSVGATLLMLAMRSSVAVSHDLRPSSSCCCRAISFTCSLSSGSISWNNLHYRNMKCLWQIFTVDCIQKQKQVTNVLCLLYLLGLPVHGFDSQVFPSGVEKFHLSSYFFPLLPMGQPLPYEARAFPQNFPNTSLLFCKLQHHRLELKSLFV